MPSLFFTPATSAHLCVTRDPPTASLPSLQATSRLRAPGPAGPGSRGPSLGHGSCPDPHGRTFSLGCSTSGFRPHVAQARHGATHPRTITAPPPAPALSANTEVGSPWHGLITSPAEGLGPLLPPLPRRRISQPGSACEAGATLPPHTLRQPKLPIIPRASRSPRQVPGVRPRSARSSWEPDAVTPRLSRQGDALGSTPKGRTRHRWSGTLACPSGTRRKARVRLAAAAGLPKVPWLRNSRLGCRGPVEDSDGGEPPPAFDPGIS